MKDKIPFYNIVNMFFVGVVFSLGLLSLLYMNIPWDWIKENSTILSQWSILISAIVIVAMYEIGFVINRMGSIIIAPIYERVFWPKGKYSIDVSEIAQSNPRFQSLITELILMRSHIMMCVILFLISLVQHMWWWGVIYLGLILVFTLGGKKHNDKINCIRQDYIKRNSQKKVKTRCRFTCNGKICYDNDK